MYAKSAFPMVTMTMAMPGTELSKRVWTAR